MSRKRGVLLSYVLMIFEVLSTLLLTPFIIKTLGQAEYGVYKLTIAINAYLLLLDLGVGNATIRYISKYRATNDKENEKKFLGVSTLYYIIISIIVIIIGIVLVAIFPNVFSNGLNHDEIKLGQKLLFITMINSAVMLGTSAYNNVLIAYEKFDISKGYSIIQIIIRIISTFVALKLEFGSIGIVVINLSLTIIFRCYFVLYVLLKLKIKPVFKNIKHSFIKEVVIYSSFILLQMISTQINASVDQILIGSLVSSSAVILAIYGVGTQIVQYFQSIGSAFNGVLMPGVVKLVEKKVSSKELTKEMIRISRVILIVLSLIWGVFLTEGQEFIILWAGIENKNAYFVAMLLMSGYIFVLTEAIGTQILWAMNEHKEQAILKFAIVLLNIVLTIFLIKWNPLYGATIGTFISIVLGDILVMNIVFVKKIHISIKEYYRGILKGILPCTIIIVIIGYLLNNVISGTWLTFVIKSGILAIIYILLMIKFGLNDYERNLIFSMLKINKKK